MVINPIGHTYARISSWKWDDQLSNIRSRSTLSHVVILLEISDPDFQINKTPPTYTHPRFEAPRWVWSSVWVLWPACFFLWIFLDAKGYPPENLHDWLENPPVWTCSSLLKMKILQCHVSFQTCICVKTSLKMGSGLGDVCSSQNWPVHLGECVVIQTCESCSFPKTKMCPETSSGWWFQRFFCFTLTRGNDPIWLFLKWVETPN